VPQLEGQKVVTAQEMARIEKIAYAKGYSDIDFMEEAGTNVADLTLDFIEENGLEKKVILFVGKGNNGGDAYVAGIKLLEKGCSVQALHFFPLEKCSPLCVKQHARFKTAGGKVYYLKEAEDFSQFSEGVILDGLVGTGFSGKAEGVLAKAIEQANHSNLPILAIDIPSGVDGSSGTVETIAIQAIETIYLGLPKWGFFVKEGWNHVGQLIGAEFGLPEEYINEAKAKAFLYHSEVLPLLFPSLKRNRHKYEAGYVLGVAGSASMPGAALLASLATLRAGAGIVRLFYPEEIEQEMSRAPLELIKEAWDLKDISRILEESKRAKAFFIGPGIGRTKSAKKMLSTLLPHIQHPVVFDADALYFMAEEPQWKLPAQAILTPHVMEMKRLLQTKEELTPEACQQYAEVKNITLVLKGAPTFIFHPHTTPLIMTRGDPGMATAGTGDVLTGILAALLAQGLQTREAACLGTYLHAVAGEIAASQRTSYGVIASDLIEYLSEAFWEVLKRPFA